MKYLFSLIFILLLVPVFVLADNYRDPVTGLYCVVRDKDIPCSGFEADKDACFPGYCVQQSCKELWWNQQYCSLKICCIVTKISRWLYFIAAGLAIIIVVWSGIMYMTAAGDETKATKAKKTLLYGLIGAAIVFGSGFIISFLSEILM